MSNGLRLAFKRFLIFKGVHLLVMVLVAAVVAVALLFQGYVGALAYNFEDKLSYPEYPGAAALHLAGYTNLPQTYARVNPLLLMAMWDVTTARGRVPVAGVIASVLDTWPEPEYGKVWLPVSLQGEIYHEQVGDSLLFSRFEQRDWRQVELEVAGYYEDGGYLSPLLVNETWISDWLGRASANETIVIYPEGDLARVRDAANRTRNAQLVMLDRSLHSAKFLVSNMYSGGAGAVVLGIAFLAIGIGTFALLVFLDSRSEMGMLKALGLKSGEAGRLLVLEFVASASFGLMLGWASAYYLQRWIDLPLQVDFALLRYGCILVAVSAFIALFAPARLICVATVNELLLKRPILLFKQNITMIEGYRPALDDLTSQGWTCLKLEQDEKGFLGTVIPDVGSYVRKGELLAWQQTWFGMGERHYLAPHDGILEVIDGQRGVLAISKSETAANSLAVVNRRDQ